MDNNASEPVAVAAFPQFRHLVRGNPRNATKAESWEEYSLSMILSVWRQQKVPRRELPELRKRRRPDHYLACLAGKRPPPAEDDNNAVPLDLPPFWVRSISNCRRTADILTN